MNNVDLKEYLINKHALGVSVHTIKGLIMIMDTINIGCVHEAVTIERLDRDTFKMSFLGTNEKLIFKRESQDSNYFAAVLA
jgi:hypothetical protein